MSMPHHNGPDLAAEVSVLKGLVRRLLRIVESDTERSQTIREFCSSESISRAFYYSLQKQGRGPRTMRHADGCVRISPEARRDWRRARERETTRASNDEDASTQQSEHCAMIVVLRAGQIYSRNGRPGRLPIGRSHFYAEVEPKLEKVVLGPKAVGYTERSLDKMIEQEIDEAAAEHDRRPRANADKPVTKTTAVEARTTCASEGQTRRRKKLEVDVKDFERGHV